MMQTPPYPIPQAPPRYTDLKFRHRLIRHLPPRWVPYALLLRLDRPAGYWLLLLPAWFAILLASPALTPWTVLLLLLFFFGAVCLRAAGCVINDLWDRDLDRRVERTADRPLASGVISGRRALALFIILLVLGVLVLLALPWRVWGWAGASLPLIVLYPLAKRLVPAPQVVLGFTFSWGALLGWLAVQTTLNAAALWLYLGSCFWILYYDTIYATQDRIDDRRLGLKSLPLLLGTRLWVGLAVFAGLTGLSWAGALGFASAGIWAWLGLGVMISGFAWQLRRFDADDPAACLRQFQGNVRLGQIWSLFLSIELLL